jgi:3-hydroxyacyl-[acyl-carrier-protein] dehydratase
MLLNDFYTIEYILREPNSFSCKVAFNPGHDIFQANYAEKPVVPGVCMMEMVKELLEQQTDKYLWLRNAALVKSLQHITADVQPMINVSWKQEGRGYNVNASFQNDSADLFKLAGSYEPNSI